MKEIVTWIVERDFPCIYFMLCRDSLIYIGETLNFRRRMGSHEFLNHHGVVDQVVYLILPKELQSNSAWAKATRQAIEQVFIHKLKPKSNRMFHPVTDKSWRCFRKYIPE